MLVTIFILVGTLSPAEKLADFNIWDYDKIGHFLMFFAWTFLFGLMRLFRSQKPPHPFLLLLVGLVFGVLIEILQYYLPINRSSELYDLIADALGSISSIPAIKLFYNKFYNT